MKNKKRIVIIFFLLLDVIIFFKVFSIYLEPNVIYFGKEYIKAEKNYYVKELIKNKTVVIRGVKYEFNEKGEGYKISNKEKNKTNKTNKTKPNTN